MKILCKKDYDYRGYTNKYIITYSKDVVYDYEENNNIIWIKDDKGKGWNFNKLMFEVFFYYPDETLNVLRVKTIDKMLNE